MKVKIIKANKRNWYYDFIGRDFTVNTIKSHPKYFYVKGGTYTGRVIDKSDCNILEDVANLTNELKIRRFPTGAIRSDNRGRERFDFISPLALKELAQFLATTENSFAQTNYFLGIPEEACLESLLRHINDFRINGKKEEAVALLFNAVALVHTIALRERGEYIERYDKTEYITKEQYNHEQKV